MVSASALKATWSDWYVLRISCLSLNSLERSEREKAESPNPRRSGYPLYDGTYLTFAGGRENDLMFVPQSRPSLSRAGSLRIW